MLADIFVVEDDSAVRSALIRRLTKQGHRVRGFDSGERALEALNQDVPDLVLMDLKMPGMTGLEVLPHLRQRAPHALVIMLTAFGTVEDAVEAMRRGAYDFIVKTIDLQSVDPVVEKALELLKLRRRVAFEAESEAGAYALTDLVADSQAMQQLLAQIQDVTPNPKVTVLLQGETGTGKEFIARVLHHNGARAAGPFVGINCTAIPKELFESELFGFERGAFTGAAQRKIGLLEQAEGGTLFLDEIGDLDLAMQAKLLRVLQERSFRRLSGAGDIAVDFRLIAATNRDLKREVAQGAFREDLFFRLNVVCFEIPPLRRRVEDIRPLCLRAMARYARDFGKDVQDLSEEASAMLERHTFPGNVRELENIIERAIIFCRGRTLTPQDLPRDIRDPAEQIATAFTQGDAQRVRVEMALGKQTLADVEAAVIQEVLRASDYNKSLASRQLGLTRFALERRLKKLEEQ